MTVLFPDRRAASGEELACAFLAAGGPLTFSELSLAAGLTGPGDIAGWLGHAISEGLVQDLGVDRDGARCYRLTARGRRLLSSRRRREPALPPAAPTVAAG